MMVPDGFFSPTTLIGRLRKACYDKLLEHDRDGAIPTNGRFVFYELEQDGAIHKSYPDKKRTPAQDISKALMDLRQEGLIPWEWIEDETREVADWDYAATVYEYLIDAVKRARLDCWDGDLPPLIICEARSTKGVLQRIAYEYLAPITATNGQAGGFIVTDIVPYLRGNDREVLYIGDHEVGGPGDQIEANTRRVIEEHTGRDIEWTRIALTQEQLDDDPRLLGLVITKFDNRTKPPRMYQAVECEAVGQVTLERLLREALEERLPEPLEDVRRRETEERKKVIAQLLVLMHRQSPSPPPPPLETPARKRRVLIERAAGYGSMMMRSNDYGS
jgi:hypothetical protein